MKLHFLWPWSGPLALYIGIPVHWLDLHDGEESTSYLCLAINMKSLLLQLTSSTSGHQGESLSFIRAHPWHAKGLAGKVVWIPKNESSCPRLLRVIPPATYHRGPHLVEISAKIQITPWVQTLMKASISCPRTKRVIQLMSWTWWWTNWRRWYWGRTSTHECGWGLPLSVSLLLHVDKHRYTKITTWFCFSLVRDPCSNLRAGWF